jgi:hypothetical protein
MNNGGARKKEIWLPGDSVPCSSFHTWFILALFDFFVKGPAILIFIKLE